RFPVAPHAKYADDVLERQIAAHKVKAGQNAAHVVSDNANRRSIDIFSAEGSPVVAVNDGVVKKISATKGGGKTLVLQDVYGNRYSYKGLGEVSSVYPVPKVATTTRGIKAVAAHGSSGPAPNNPASA